MAATLDFKTLFDSMVDAAKISLSANWPKIKDLATTSIKTLATNIIDIEKMRLDNAITEEQARLMIGIQKDAFKIVLLSEQGLGLLAVEAALNAMINVIRTVVNDAIGFILL